MRFFPGAAQSPKILGLAVVGLGTSLTAFDVAVNVAFPAITDAFNLQTRDIQWVVVSYVLLYGSLMLAFGRLGDLMGYRRIFRAGIVLSAVAFVLCAMAGSYGWLLAARAVQGVAAALVLSCAPAIATSLFDESRRVRVLGAYAGMFAAAGVAGPLLGGASIALLDWSGVFWFRVPIALLTLLLLPLLPPLPPLPEPERRAFDPAASTLLATGMALLLLAPSLLVIADTRGYAAWPVLAATILLWAFVRRQRRSAESLLPPAVLSNRGLALLNLASVVVHLTHFAVPLLVPYYLARIAGEGPMQIGMLLAMSPAGILIGSVLAPAAVHAIGLQRTAITGAALLALGQMAISFWGHAPMPVLMSCVLLLHGAGVGLFNVAYTDKVIAMLPRGDRGVAGSVTMVTRTTGFVVGAAALSAALQMLEADALAAGMPEREAFLAAFQSVFRYSALAFLVCIALLCLRRKGWSSA